MPPVGIGWVRALLSDYGAVHDNPDDNVKLFEYESFTRNMAVNNATLLCVGRVRSRSEGGTTGGAINRGHSKKKQSEVTGLLLETFKAGHWPCFIFRTTFIHVLMPAGGRLYPQLKSARRPKHSRIG
jgi:hypothetical protein